MKTTSNFFCKECGYESAKWMGKCPSCNSWNSFEEEIISKSKNSKSMSSKTGFLEKTEIKKLEEIKVEEASRVDVGFEELNRVFGSGIVKGSISLVGGEPGIGKSTLIMQVCGNLSKVGKVLYVSGEESESQVKLRADRLKVASPSIFFLNETNISEVENKVESLNPEFCIVDSIQTMYDDEIASTSGSVSQVKEVTARLMYLAKRKNITMIVIGHVTKDGVIAGPRVLEHMVDTVIYIEGDRFSENRIVRSVKNRFGSTNEIGIFVMKNEGMVEVKNKSETFLGDKEENTSGSATSVTTEGSSNIFFEVQALTAHSYYNLPRRVANGIDFNRLNMIVAVLEKKCNLSLGSNDIYVSALGGLKVNDPSSDLATAISIYSSFKNVIIPNDILFVGEIGLTGEIRNVANIEKKVKEAVRMNYKKIYCSKYDAIKVKKEINNENIIGVSNLMELINIL
ncbi:MAG: DNA repair protein RadA [Clostridia bacterium]|nr:DNA repair protein RadA [Clostridia bacterium]